MTDVAPVLFKKRAGKGAAARKRPATPPPDSDSEYSSEGEDGVRIKRRKTAGLTATATTARAQETLGKSSAFSGDRTAAIASNDDATKQSNWFEVDPTKQSRDNDPSTLGGETYTGTSTYQSFLQKNPNAPPKLAGPQKGPSNIRSITVTDFAPDVCKDYKQTGFCGFGDSCKFLHAREDYKQGWQLDKEWESVGTKKTGGTIVASANKDALKKDDEDEESMLDNIPFACIICKGPYKDPVVTKCKHYFCEACALKRHKTKGGKGCAACGADTGGSFGMAKNLRRLLEKKRERIKRQKERRREEGEEVSSDDE